MACMSAGGPRPGPIHGSGTLAGPALTVKTRPGDNLVIHKVLDLALPGDLLGCGRPRRPGQRPHPEIMIKRFKLTMRHCNYS